MLFASGTSTSVARPLVPLKSALAGELAACSRANDQRMCKSQHVLAKNIQTQKKQLAKTHLYISTTHVLISPHQSTPVRQFIVHRHPSIGDPVRFTWTGPAVLPGTTVASGASHGDGRALARWTTTGERAIETKERIARHAKKIQDGQKDTKLSIARRPQRS